jgi:branched-chain amino acid transport system substrate-binding protein
MMAPILLVSGLAAGCTAGSAGGPTTTLVIGAELDKNATDDVAYGQALQLRVDELNTSGRLGNRKLVLRTQYDNSDPTTMLRDVTSVGDDPNVVALVAGGCDQCVVGAAKAIDDKQLPTIALAPSDEVASPVADRHYVFKLGPNSDDSTAAMVSELTRVQVPDVAIVYTDDLYGRDCERALNAELAKTGIKIKLSRSIKPTATDISQTIGALTDDKPSALLVLAGPDQAELAATSARKAGFTGLLYFDAAAAGNQFIAPADVAATNNAQMIFTQTLAIDDVIATTPAKTARKQWFRDYTSRWGSYSGVAAFAGDAVDLIADAVLQAGNDRSRIRDILETSQLDGLSGAIRFSSDNHSGLLPQALTVLVARSGRWRLES